MNEAVRLASQVSVEIPYCIGSNAAITIELVIAIYAGGIQLVDTVNQSYAVGVETMAVLRGI